MVHIPGRQYDPVIHLRPESTNALEKLKDMGDRGLANQAGSVHRITDACESMPYTPGEDHGLHGNMLPTFRHES